MNVNDFKLAPTTLTELQEYHNKKLKEVKDSFHDRMCKVLNELEAEKKIVNYYADNGYSVAIKRVKARTQCN